eukprot:CAMPEP_0184294484 /NCGR_PEP_ID=MMETSP1049-20130417/5664_1 /TAXON_ID=77928 /ORGANISM="Proteomonas sulcata, Strain CCMP704" /LENGTH=80 /DNA_ID=CAMNT_0026602783 /DNA_START=199 /DNA_END=441 /DNA_ORIENTATION=+
MSILEEATQSKKAIDPRDVREKANIAHSTSEGPATSFRNAASKDGVGMWGPIMGGVVAVGGTAAIIGSILHEEQGATVVA